MKHYSEDTIFGGDFDHNSMEVGDSFDMNGTRYTVERKFSEGPFMRYTKEPVTLFVVSFAQEEGGLLYQVCIWSGDWEGCHPVSDSIEGALFSELARINEIDAASEATAEELYKAGCDPITAQYLATGELPG